MTNWVGTPGKDSIAIAGPRPYVDVRAYGAKGDGVTDDTAAIQAAFNAAAGSPVLFSGTGPYIISSPLVVPITGGPSALIGNAAVGPELGGHGTVIKAGATFPATGGMVRNSTSTHIEGLRIENLRFDANSKAQYGLDLTAFKMPVLYNVWAIHATSHGIFIGSTPVTVGPQMYYVWAYQNAGDGLHVEGGINGLWGFNTVLSTNTGRGLYLSGTQCTFVASNVSNNVGIGVSLTGASEIHLLGGIMDSNGGDTNPQLEIVGASSKILVSSMGMNHNTATSAAAVNVDNADEVTLANNLIRFINTTTGNARGIHLGPGGGNVTKFSLIGGSINVPGTTTFGVYATDGGVATYSKILISGVRFTTTSLAVNIAGLTAANQAQVVAVNNPGWNPQPAAAIAVEASPFTYTNNDGYPETVSVSGGTVSGITLRGTSTGLTSGMFTLYPGDALVVTYSGLPTMNKYPM